MPTIYGPTKEEWQAVPVETRVKLIELIASSFDEVNRCQEDEKAIRKCQRCSKHMKGRRLVVYKG